MNQPTTALLPRLEKTVQNLKRNFNQISPERKTVLDALTGFAQEKMEQGEQINLNFICTHNSRRSHIAQLWAQAAGFYFSIPNLTAFSGGTEATAFNPRAVQAMREAGFEISTVTEGNNPVYSVGYSDESPRVKVFSKRYDDPVNPTHNFAAVMTCSHADENCPLIPGADKRIALTYDDPKDFDGTPDETAKYRERVLEIGRDILYAFSNVKNDTAS